MGLIGLECSPSWVAPNKKVEFRFKSTLNRVEYDQFKLLISDLKEACIPSNFLMEKKTRQEFPNWCTDGVNDLEWGQPT